jgi:hypothetical protein
MNTLEVIALLIVASFVAVRARFGTDARAFLIRLLLLVVASWVAEDTCIRAYGFYFYNPDWSIFIDRVPLAIVLIWPVVIHSAWELAVCLLGSRGRRFAPLLGGAVVLADASMIEPIAVNSGLWTWTEPGLFDVPPIGIVGWAYYAGLCMLVFERVELRRRAEGASSHAAWANAIAIALAPAGTHVLLLASWWGLFRWINRPLDPWPFVAAFWGLSLVLTARSLQVGARRRVPSRDMLNRIPAAVFFLVLLALDARDVPALIAYGLAFAPPYLSLTRFAPSEAASMPSSQSGDGRGRVLP